MISTRCPRTGTAGNLTTEPWDIMFPIIEIDPDHRDR